MLALSDSSASAKRSGDRILHCVAGTAEKLSQICPDETTKNIIIRMHDVQALDVSALKVLTSLVDGCKSRGVRVVFAHVQAQPMKILKKSGFFDKVGNENFADTVDDAILAVSKN